MKSRVRIISTFLALLFTLEQVAFAASEVMPKQLDIFEKPTIDLKLPESIATVEDSWKAPDSSKLVYLIQDAHTNESGQINLAKTLDILLEREKSDLQYIFVEAGLGDNSLTFLRDKASLSKRKQVATEYLKKGILHGEEYLDLTSDHNFVIWGVEDFSLYQKAVDAYRAVVKDREKFQNYISRIQSTINTLKPRIFNPSLLSFDEKHSKYLKEEVSLTDYFQILSQEADKQNISLLNFPHLKALNNLKDKESKIDFKLANEEQQKAIQSLSPEDQKEIMEYAKKESPFKLGSNEHKEEKAFYTLLEEKLRQPAASSLQLAVKAPNLMQYFSYLKDAKSLDPKAILDEQKRLESELFQALAKTPDEKLLIRSQLNLRLLQKLFDLKLTPDEYQEYKQDSKDFTINQLTGFLNKKIMDLQSYYERALFLEDGYDKIVNNSETFYELTKDRDEAFLKTLSLKMAQEKQTQAVLITGGFHATNLKAMFKKQNISFVSIMPQVYQETNQKRYESLLLNQKIDPKFLTASPMKSMARLASVALTPELQVIGARLAEEKSRSRIIDSELWRVDRGRGNSVSRSTNYNPLSTLQANAGARMAKTAQQIEAQLTRDGLSSLSLEDLNDYLSDPAVTWSKDRESPLSEYLVYGTDKSAWLHLNVYHGEGFFKKRGTPTLWIRTLHPSLHYRNHSFERDNTNGLVFDSIRNDLQSKFKWNKYARWTSAIFSASFFLVSYRTTLLLAYLSHVETMQVWTGRFFMEVPMPGSQPWVAPEDMDQYNSLLQRSDWTFTGFAVFAGFFVGLTAYDYFVHSKKLPAKQTDSDARRSMTITVLPYGYPKDELAEGVSMFVRTMTQEIKKDFKGLIVFTADGEKLFVESPNNLFDSVEWWRALGQRVSTELLVGYPDTSRFKLFWFSNTSRAVLGLAPFSLPNNQIEDQVLSDEKVLSVLNGARLALREIVIGLNDSRMNAEQKIVLINSIPFESNQDVDDPETFRLLVQALARINIEALEDDGLMFSSGFKLGFLLGGHPNAINYTIDPWVDGLTNPNTEIADLAMNRLVYWSTRWGGSYVENIRKKIDEPGVSASIKNGIAKLFQLIEAQDFSLLSSRDRAFLSKFVVQRVDSEGAYIVLREQKIRLISPSALAEDLRKWQQKNILPQGLVFYPSTDGQSIYIGTEHQLLSHSLADVDGIVSVLNAYITDAPMGSRLAERKLARDRQQTPEVDVTDKFKRVLFDRLGDSLVYQEMLALMQRHHLRVIEGRVPKSVALFAESTGSEHFNPNLTMFLSSPSGSSDLTARMYTNYAFDQSSYEAYVHELVELQTSETVLSQLLVDYPKEDAFEKFQVLQGLGYSDFLTVYASLRRQEEYKFTQEEIDKLERWGSELALRLMVDEDAVKKIRAAIGNTNPTRAEFDNYVRLLREIPARYGRGISVQNDGLIAWANIYRSRDLGVEPPKEDLLFFPHLRRMLFKGIDRSRAQFKQEVIILEKPGARLAGAAWARQIEAAKTFITTYDRMVNESVNDVSLRAQAKAVLDPVRTALKEKDIRRARLEVDPSRQQLKALGGSNQKKFSAGRAGQFTLKILDQALKSIADQLTEDPAKIGSWVYQAKLLAERYEKTRNGDASFPSLVEVVSILSKPDPDITGLRAIISRIPRNLDVAKLNDMSRVLLPHLGEYLAKFEKEIPPVSGSRLSAADTATTSNNDFKRVEIALNDEKPKVVESSKYGIRLYFIKGQIHMYISDHGKPYVSGLVGDFRRYDNGDDEAIRPGNEIEIPDEKSDGFLLRLNELLETLRSDEGVNEFLTSKQLEVQTKEKFGQKMLSIEQRYPRQPTADETQRQEFLAELSGILDTKFEDLTAEQIDRIQTILSKLGFKPLYDGEKYPYNAYPNFGMDSEIYNIQQGDVVYIQHMQASRNPEQEVLTEHSGHILEPPRFPRPLLKMRDGTKINLNMAKEIIVDGGRGGHYFVQGETDSSSLSFLTGGLLRPETIREDGGNKDLKKAGKSNLVEWPGVDLSLPIKIVTVKKVTKPEAGVWMTGEKVTVLEAPNTQNNGVFQYRKQNGEYGDRDMVDINRVYRLSTDKQIASKKSHLFKIGDKVYVRIGEEIYEGSVEEFYAAPFQGRGMRVKIDNAPDKSKPYLRVHFLHQGEAMLVGAKNNVAKPMIIEAFKKTYGMLAPKVLRRRTIDAELGASWDGFYGAYKVLFENEGFMGREDFDPKMIETLLLNTVGITLDDLYSKLTSGQTLDVGGDAFIRIGALLNDDERSELRRLHATIKFAVNLSGGAEVAETGTSPWAVKVEDFDKVRTGQPVRSDFSLKALLEMFITDTMTVRERLILLYRISEAREKYAFQDILVKFIEMADQLESSSIEGRQFLVKKHSSKILPDEKDALVFALGARLSSTVLEPTTSPQAANAEDSAARLFLNIGPHLSRSFRGTLPIMESDLKNVRLYVVTREGDDALVVVNNETSAQSTYNISTQALTQLRADQTLDISNATDITDETFKLRDANATPAESSPEPAARVVLGDSFPDLTSDAMYQSLILHFASTLHDQGQAIFVFDDKAKAQRIASLARTLGVKNPERFRAMTKEELQSVKLPKTFLVSDAGVDKAKIDFGSDNNYVGLQTPTESNLIGNYALRPIGVLMDRISHKQWDSAADLYGKMTGSPINAVNFQNALKSASLIIPYISKLIGARLAQVYLAERAFGQAA